MDSANPTIPTTTVPIQSPSPMEPVTGLPSASPTNDVQTQMSDQLNPTAPQPNNLILPSSEQAAQPPTSPEPTPSTTTQQPYNLTTFSDNLTNSFGIDHQSATVPEGRSGLPNSQSQNTQPSAPGAFFSTPSTQEVQAMKPVSTIQSVQLPENPLGKEVNFFADRSLADPTGSFANRLAQFNTTIVPADPTTQPAIVLPTAPPQPTSDLQQIYSQVQNHSALRIYSVFLIVLIVSLLLLGGQSLVRAIIFIFVDFPALEAAFYGHQYGETSLNQFAIGSGMLIVTSATSFFFALQYVTHFRQWRSMLFCVFGVLLIIAGIMAVILTPSLSLQSYL